MIGMHPRVADQPAIYDLKEPALFPEVWREGPADSFGLVVREAARDVVPSMSGVTVLSHMTCHLTVLDVVIPEKYRQPRTEPLLHAQQPLGGFFGPWQAILSGIKVIPAEDQVIEIPVFLLQYCLNPADILVNIEDQEAGI
jgi:hypothetical protein